jgi:microcystin-dependent protein
MTLYKWSQTASADATADSTINWAEGQAPSSVNDSARGMMAAAAKYRDDIAGAIVTTGTTTAYAVSSYQVFDTLPHLAGQMIAFTPHITNAATVTLNVDSLGAKPLRTAPGAELLAGTIIQGTPYVAVYNNSDGAFYLRGFFGNPYNVPLGAGMDYWGSVVPNSSFAFPAGQAISRVTYATLFSLVGTAYGTGDGSTTFNLPDKTGRVSAMQEASATRRTTAGFGGNSTVLGATGGLEKEGVGTSNIPQISVSVSGTVTVAAGGNVPVTNGSWNNNSGNTTGSGGGDFPQGTSGVANQTSFSGSNTLTGTIGNLNPAALPIVQPTIICNYIVRII